jgi:transcription antitermination factor NusA-like protein
MSEGFDQPTQLAKLLINEKGLAEAALFWELVKKGLDKEVAEEAKRKQQEAQKSKITPPPELATSTNSPLKRAASTELASAAKKLVQSGYLKGDHIDSTDTKVMLLVPPLMVGVIIGTKGSEVKRMEQAFGCRIKVENNDEPSTNPSEPMRRLCISGKLSQCHLTVMEICKVMMRKGDAISSIKIVIPNQTARVVIGKGGSTINALQTSTKSRISVEKEMCYGAMGRVVLLDGTHGVNRTVIIIPACCISFVAQMLNQPTADACVIL